MKLPFVSRKAYETLQENCKKINERRFELAQDNIKLQGKILELTKEIEKLTPKKKTTKKATKKTTTKKTTKKEAK